MTSSLGVVHGQRCLKLLFKLETVPARRAFFYMGAYIDVYKTETRGRSKYKGNDGSVKRLSLIC